MADQDHAAIGLFQGLHDRSPVLHRKLDIGDRSLLPLAPRLGDGDLRGRGDDPRVADLFLQDMDTVVLLCPASGLLVGHEADEARTIPGFCNVDPKGVAVILRVLAHRIDRSLAGVAVHLGHADQDRVGANGGRGNRSGCPGGGRGHQELTALEGRSDPSRVA